jgi:hypothetical protein
VVMNNRLLVPRKTPGLLDLVPGAAAAYSLRSLSNSYADPVVTVRRSSDDAEEDFTAAEVADGTLAAFCGAGDGFVKQWWDQSGNGAHAVAAADANEPQIVDSGVVITEEGKPAIQFDGASDKLSISDSTVLDLPATVFIVLTHSSSTAGDRYIFARQSSGSNGGVLIRQLNVTGFIQLQLIDAASPFTSVIATNRGGQDVVTAIASPPNTSIYSNFLLGGTDASASGFANAAFPVAIGARPDAASLYWDSKIQEIIAYPSDLTAQRELVEGLIAWGYSI